jgi:hypothetical protein
MKKNNKTARQRLIILSLPKQPNNTSTNSKAYLKLLLDQKENLFSLKIHKILKAPLNLSNPNRLSKIQCYNVRVAMSNLLIPTMRNIKKMKEIRNFRVRNKGFCKTNSCNS